VKWKNPFNLAALSMNASTANDHPFQTLFETLGRLPVAHAESVNWHAYDILAGALSAPLEKVGRCILLKAPRAGHGKTHLLSRIQHDLGASHEFIPLQPALGCRIDAGTVTDDTLRRLVRPLPAAGGMCVLDLITRRLFALALQPLVGSGEVPCQDREGALAALRTRPIETFDFHHPNAVTAHWARENFEVLGQRLSLELAQRCELPVREIAFWVEALFRFAAMPLENPGRVRALADMVHRDNAPDGDAMERLEALLGLVSLLVRVVLVADEVEGFSSDETAALRLAAFLGTIRQSVERLEVILSLNQDVWQSAFLPRLSDGLADRLSEVVIELKPLTEAEMVALLECRVPGLGAKVYEKIDHPAAGTHARGLIRAGGIAWQQTAAEQQRAPATVAAAPEPAVAWPVAEFSPTQEPLNEPQAEVLAEPEMTAVEAEVIELPAEAPAEAAVARIDSPFEIAEPAAVESPLPFSQNFTPEIAIAMIEAETAAATQAAASAAPETAPQPPPSVVAEAAPAAGVAAADTDRVDELLRQFRERYGRGGL
jgi:hypothetical protein